LLSRCNAENESYKLRKSYSCLLAQSLAHISNMFANCYVRKVIKLSKTISIQ
jgi:hypothetical protein